eukprot:4824906-Prymnesium_polylepis.1
MGSGQRTSRGRHRQLPIPNSGRQHRHDTNLTAQPAPPPRSQRGDPPKARGPQHSLPAPCHPRAGPTGELTVHYGDAYDRGAYHPTGSRWESFSMHPGHPPL